MKRNLILMMVVAVIFSCTKDPSKPSVGLNNKISAATTTVSMITTTSARCGGTATSGGADSIIARGVCWGTVNNPTINNSKTSDGTGSGVYVSVITGLTTNKQYYVRAYVVSTERVAYGETRIFKTL